MILTYREKYNNKYDSGTKLHCFCETQKDFDSIVEFDPYSEVYAIKGCVFEKADYPEAFPVYAIARYSCWDQGRGDVFFEDWRDKKEQFLAVAQQQVDEAQSALVEAQKRYNKIKQEFEEWGL